MVNRNETNTARQNDKSSFSAENFPARQTQYKELAPDDLIVSLANAHENKRAQQVTEWEKLRVQNVKRAIV